MKDTSLKAYRDLYCQGRGQQQAYRILSKMRLGVKYTRNQLEKLTGVRINAVAGRVHDLVSAGFLREVETPVKCPVSGYTVHQVYRPRMLRGNLGANA